MARPGPMRFAVPGHGGARDDLVAVVDGWVDRGVAYCGRVRVYAIEDDLLW